MTQINRSDLLAIAACSVFFLSGFGGQTYTPAVEGGPIHEGVEITVDLPPDQQIHNIGAPVDGLGLCVFASMEHASRWHNQRKLFDVIHKVPRGGGWPEKVEQVLRQISPESEVVQYVGSDPSFLDREIKKRKMVCVTYGYGERYRNNLGTIAHMVNLVHLDERWACVLDNNFPCEVDEHGVTRYHYEWMERDEFIRRWLHPRGQGWAYSFVAPPPPPTPKN